MRSLLYLVGSIIAFVGAFQVLTSSSATTQIVNMLVVVCGVVLIGAAAIIGAIEALRAPQVVAQPQQMTQSYAPSPVHGEHLP